MGVLPATDVGAPELCGVCLRRCSVTKCLMLGEPRWSFDLCGNETFPHPHLRVVHTWAAGQGTGHANPDSPHVAPGPRVAPTVLDALSVSLKRKKTQPMVRGPWAGAP